MMIFHLANTLLLATSFANALPSSLRSPTSIPVPVVIWHGLGDRYDAPGLLQFKTDLESRPNLKGIFVHIIQIGADGAADSKASFFGKAIEQIDHACEQLLSLDRITDKNLNPSGKFDAIGFSQGSQFLRGLVEKCGGKGNLHVRNLITLGGQHMGISALPPCPPGSSPFSACRLMHLSLVREVNTFLKDINNERAGDQQVGPAPLNRINSHTFGEEEPEKRNSTYKENFSSLENLVLLRFSQDATVVPPHSAHFTLPSPDATNCPSPPLPSEPLCYLEPVPWEKLPLYTQDYIGLRALDEAGRVTRGVCSGVHMEIDEECWEGIVAWLGDGNGKIPKQTENPSRFLVQL